MAYIYTTAVFFSQRLWEAALKNV